MRVFSCMSPMSATWKLFRARGMCDKFDLVSILSKRDQFLKFIGKFR